MDYPGDEIPDDLLKRTIREKIRSAFRKLANTFRSKGRVTSPRGPKNTAARKLQKPQKPAKSTATSKTRRKTSSLPRQIIQYSSSSSSSDDPFDPFTLSGIMLNPAAQLVNPEAQLVWGTYDSSLL
jgi:hypothetical protein